MSKNNWFRNLIFENAKPAEDEKKEQSQPGTVANKPPSPPPVFENIQKEQTINNHITISGKIDQTLLNKLCAALDEQTVEGIDYLKFKKSVDSLKDFQPEENIRFMTAFVTLKATNPTLSKGYLMQTIDKYVELMEKERQVGLNQLKALRTKDVDKKEQEITEAIKKVEKMKEEIQQLTRFISETEIETTDKKNEFTMREADFNVTVDKIVNQLKNDKEKINTIIK